MLYISITCIESKFNEKGRSKQEKKSTLHKFRGMCNRHLNLVLCIYGKAEKHAAWMINFQLSVFLGQTMNYNHAVSYIFPQDSYK